MVVTPPQSLESLHGLALGDAFGDRWFQVSTDEAPVELTARRPRPGPWHWTDDTAMAYVLYQHLARHDEVVPDVLAADFAAEYTAHPGRKYGASMHQVLRRIQDGEDWRSVTSGMFEGQGSWGNGAAMRVAPLGAWFAADLAEVVEQARLSALVTHFHPEAVAGAIAVAVAAALAARGRGGPAPERSAFLAEVADHLPESDVRSGLRTAARLPAGTSVRHASVVLGSGLLMSGPDTVPFALWAAAGSLDSLPEAIWRTLEGWGDMDTTCAIAAGVVAARTGLRGVPVGWWLAREQLPPLHRYAPPVFAEIDPFLYDLGPYRK
ncbi:ADP-ribosylglycohydrolase family protein [Kitasatospora sp. NPDC096147]|uniref:ADP-ribosylglycohydrolase family protein n=1 Tax=Kitasatospora sp. NPDC096147 TaxID=3364093 RepID=UPI00380F6952